MKKSNRVLKVSHIDSRDGDAVFNAAERIGSDGRGRDGLRGYVRYLAKQRPVQFVTLLRKVAVAQLNGLIAAQQPEKRVRQKRVGVGFLSPDHENMVYEAVIDAAEKLGRNGRGYDGVVGYMTMLASTRSLQFMRLIGAMIGPDYILNELRKSRTRVDIELR